MPNNLNEVIKELTDKIKKTNNKKTMRALAAEAIRLIKSRTREGRGVKEMGGTEYDFPALKPATIARRRKMRLSQFTTPSTSNITATGRLLASLRVGQVDTGQVGIEAAGDRPEGLSNYQLVKYLAEKDRVFANLSVAEIKKLTLYYEELIQKDLK